MRCRIVCEFIQVWSCGGSRPVQSSFASATTLKVYVFSSHFTPCMSGEDGPCCGWRSRAMWSRYGWTDPVVLCSHNWICFPSPIKISRAQSCLKYFTEIFREQKKLYLHSHKAEHFFLELWITEHHTRCDFPTSSSLPEGIWRPWRSQSVTPHPHRTASYLLML